MNLAQLQQIAPNAPVAWLAALVSVAPSYGINTPLREAHFVGQLCHESRQFTRLQEDMDYSASRILEVWPTRFENLDDARAYAHQPMKLANRVYANRFGNRDESSGDGWRYRGRGPIMTTFSENYIKIGFAIKVSLPADPDLLLSPPIGCKASAYFWQSRGINTMADRDDIVAVSRKVSGSGEGLAGRVAWTNKAKAVLL